MASYSGVMPRGSNRSAIEPTLASGLASTTTSWGSASSNCTIVTVASPACLRCSSKNRSNPRTTSSSIDPIDPDRSRRNQMPAPAPAAAFVFFFRAFLRALSFVFFVMVLHLPADPRHILSQ